MKELSAATGKSPSRTCHKIFAPNGFFSNALALILALVAVLAVPSVRAADVVAAGKNFVDLLAKGDFTNAVARYDATMATALPEPKLREAWDTLQSQAGRFRRQLRARAEKDREYDIVLVTCQFEKAMLDAKVVFDASGKVAGLFFLPTTPPAEWFRPPPYAQTNSFRETGVRVGSGRWVLPGTLTMPTGAGPRPAVVLVHGSGALDRDETVGANKPFRDLAWGLASKGVAVLRYEKRTKEYAVAMAEMASRITLKDETVDDAVNAVDLLRNTEGIDPHRIFVLGHSHGGLAAPRIAQAEPGIAGLIVMAGPTRPLDVVVMDQIRYLASLEGTNSPEVQDRIAEMEKQMEKVKNLTQADASSSELIFGVAPVYWLDLRSYDQVATAKALKQPLLILQGGRDYQVSATDFYGWKNGLGTRTGVTFKFYPDLNHLFMTGTGKSKPTEYNRPGHVSEEVVDDIVAWIGTIKK
jgi:dienelactone hydrolase